MGIEVIKEMVFIYLVCLVLMMTYSDASAQYRPDLLLREDWAEIPPATPVTQEHVDNSDLNLRLHGPGADGIKKSHHEQPADDPYYIWSGQCEGNWAVSLTHRQFHVDLSEYAKVVWRTKQSGLRCLHLVLKLADGTWLVSDQCDDQSADWRVHQFNIDDITWYSLNIETVVEGEPVKEPDLSKVEEVGFTDLMKGGGSAASSRLDWIEVYGQSIKH